MDTIEFDGRSYIGWSLPRLIEAGVSSTAIDAEIDRQRREKIKAECRRRIYCVASAEAQMNINGAVNLICAKTAAQRTSEDASLLAAFSQSLQWITDMRAAVEMLDADASADYLADAAWPVCPAEVAALAAQF